MGVLGLTAFLQKTCPDLLKRIPDRFRGISGKKIVIDGTLITQRFHFAPSPHPYRHVLGWYRLIQELNDSGVSAICVFDGKQRNAAKAGEIMRRSEVRKIAQARGSLENDRFQRLRKLKTVLGSFHKLDNSSQDNIAALLRRRELSPAASEMISQKIPEIITPAIIGNLAVAKREPKNNQSVVLDDDTEQSEQDISRGEPVSAKLDTSGPSTNVLPAETTPFLARSFVQDRKFPLSLPPVAFGADSTQTNPEDLPGTLISLYADYVKSIPQLESLSQTSVSPAAKPIQAVTDLEDMRADQIMSKAQQKLTVDEGRVWLGITSPSTAEKMYGVPSDSVESEQAIGELAEKSHQMSESFQRRTNIPTDKTYEECKEIIRAFGIPCVEASGPFEAEALAASIVLHGHADYVASEDTDVVVYEAPLIRNICNRQDPIVIVSGTEVRTRLELERDAFIDFALLLGTDFSQRIKNVGPTRAYKFIKEYGSIERILELEPKYDLRLPKPAYLAQVELARIVFSSLPPIPNQAVLQPNKKSDAEVTQIMERYGCGKAVLIYGGWDYKNALEGNYFGDDPSLY